jgi:hypothetical protein
MAEISDDVEKYFEKQEEAEYDNNTLANNSKYVSLMSDIYDYSKLKSLPDSTINNIYQNSVDNIVILNTYYDKSIINTATAFFINDGIIVTTFDYIEKSLMNGQFILIRDKDGKLYDYDGFITVNPKLDIAVIKLKDKTPCHLTLGDSKKLVEEDPVISISTKSGFGLSAASGIVINNDSAIKSAIPLSKADEGSPLFNSNGEVVGINTSKSVEASVSISIPSLYLSELQSKLKNIDFNSIKTISFDSLKDKFYQDKINDDMKVNQIKKSIWNEFKIIGNIENNIKLDLVKASYYNGVVSLRYKNPIYNFISNMSVASSLKAELINEGFNIKCDTKDKAIFENNKYQVIIMDQFNYLIVLMVRK